MTQKRTMIIMGAVVIISIGLVIWWFKKDSQGAPLKAAPNISFVVETATIKPLAHFLVERRYIGTIKAEKFSLLSPKVAGTVASIDVAAGQAVKRGQLLFTLTSSVEKQSVMLAEKGLQLLNEELARSRKLFRSNDITKSELEKAEREVLQQQAKLEEQKRLMENVELRAPFDGVVGVPRVVLGETVQPATLLISIMEGPYAVYINIPASRLAEVEVGQKVRLKSETTTIAAVEKSVDPTTRTGFAKAILGKCDECIIGDSMFVHLTVHEKPNAILITKNAIYYKNHKPHVVVVTKDSEGKSKAAIREISVGEEKDGEVEVITGLVDGDEIVTANPKRIPDKANLSVLK